MAIFNSIIVTMNSNEIDINEWITHNILLGFSHIFIYDDHSNPPITNIICELPQNISEHVTIYRLDSHYEINVGDYLSPFNTIDTSQLLYYDEEIYKKHKLNKQQYLMNYFLKYHKNIANYCLFTDIDEFIYLKDWDNINDYLLTMKDYDIIRLPWIYYGTSYYVDKPKGLLIDNFRYHANEYAGGAGKSIINMNTIDEIYCIHKIIRDNNKDKYTIHNVRYFEYDLSMPLFTHPIHINHYVCKSYKSVIRKKKEHCLGQTSGFKRPLGHILCFGVGNALNIISEDFIMEKYVKNINDVLNYELNTSHKNIKNNTVMKLICDDIEITFLYIINNVSMDLLNKILYSDNIKYIEI